MKILLFNKKGFALIALVIIMTITGLIGASIASLMGAKHKGLPFQVNSYNALNLANTGVEWATRYIIYDYGPYPTTDTTVTLTGVGGIGQFTVTYNTAQDRLTSKGNYLGAVREIRINEFRHQFVSQTSKITIYPGTSPYYNSNYIYISFINNGSQSLTITGMSLNRSGTGTVHLEEVWNWALHWWGWGWDNLYSGPTVTIPNTITLTSSSSHNTDASSWWAIGFSESWGNLRGNYTLTFSGTIGGTPFTSTIKFNL